MIIDCHTHVWATSPPAGRLSARMLYSPSFRLLARRLGVDPGPGPYADDQIARKLVETLDQTPQLDAAVALALDAVHAPDGTPEPARTHMAVSNDHVAALAARHPKVLFGCSVHPYRQDAVAELERCVRAGAVLMKWLPIVQDFDPADPRCLPVYEALAHHRLPLLCHTGIEHSLPLVRPSYGDPKRLVPALQRGVTVIAAHCGSRELPLAEPNWIPDFVRLAHRYENLYGDTAAMNLPGRSYAYRYVLHDPVVRAKLVHGSDWPLPSIPPVTQLGPWEATTLLLDGNWMRRDVRIKRKLFGADDPYWGRAATLLRLPGRRPALDVPVPADTGDAVVAPA